LRFGGGGNDFLHYGPPNHLCSSHDNSDDWGCLNASHWTEMYEMAHGAEAALLFGVSFDKTAACEWKGAYKWDGANVQEMIR